jgi:predicted transcriptional regulator
MKSATIPPIRVAPAFRGQIESVLQQGESLSEFVENAVRQSVLKRQQQLEFIQRGLAAIEDTQRLNNGIAATEVLAQLDAKLVTARKTLSKRAK